MDHKRAERRVSAKVAIKSDRMGFFGYVDLKKKRFSYLSVMHFEGSLAPGPHDICNLFADFIQRTYADGCLLIADQISCSSL
jgi:hypothetical protein